MSTSKPAFKTIDFGSTVAAVEKFAKQQGVPDLVFPAARSEEKGPTAPEPLAVLSEPAPAQRRTKAQPKPATPAPIKRIAVELPEYLVRAVSDKAHSSDTTIRYVITHALQKAGFFVDAVDLKEDRRRER